MDFQEFCSVGFEAAVIGRGELRPKFRCLTLRSNWIDWLLRLLSCRGRNSLEGGIGYIQMQLHFAADFLLGEESDDLRWAAWPWKSPQRTFS